MGFLVTSIHLLVLINVGKLPPGSKIIQVLLSISLIASHHKPSLKTTFGELNHLNCSGGSPQRAQRQMFLHPWRARDRGNERKSGRERERQREREQEKKNNFSLSCILRPPIRQINKNRIIVGYDLRQISSSVLGVRL